MVAVLVRRRCRRGTGWPLAVAAGVNLVNLLAMLAAPFAEVIAAAASG
jgi:hypothetical protein